jgi:hypothetical protein
VDSQEVFHLGLRWAVMEKEVVERRRREYLVEKFEIYWISSFFGFILGKTFFLNYVAQKGILDGNGWKKR